VNWTLAAAAPLIVGGLFLATGRIHPAILAYHVLCAVMIFRDQRRIRDWFRWETSTLRWTVGATVLVLGALACGPLIQNPSPDKAVFHRVLFPFGHVRVAFPIFAVYTLLVHAPLEEIFWRAMVMDPGRPERGMILAANALCFGLLHAVPLGLVLGGRGILYALPACGAGALWAFVTFRSRSLWPALVSHWGADAAILAGMWFFFIR